MLRDYFYKNRDVYTLPAGTTFCPFAWQVAEGETMHFTGNMSTENAGPGNDHIFLILKKDSQNVAVGTQDSVDIGGAWRNMNASVIYKEKMSQSSTFELCLNSHLGTTIPANNIQFEYQIYG